MSILNTFLLLAVLITPAVGIAGQTPTPTPAVRAERVGDIVSNDPIPPMPATPPRRISGGVLNGKATSLPVPEYPAAAKAVKANGGVNVQVLIDEDGSVASAAAVSGHPLLRAAAEAAARKAKFSPTTINGGPVKVSGVIVYNFNLPTAADEKLDIVKLSTFLYLVRSAVGDLNGLNRSMDSADFIAESLTEFPDRRETLAPMLTLKDLAADKRLAVLDEVIENSRAKGNAGREWQFMLGRRIGELFGQIFPHISTEGVDASTINEAELKAGLIRIKELVPQAPADTTPEVLAGLKALGDMNARPKLSAPENLFELLGNLLKLVDSVAPDDGKPLINVR